MYLTEQPNETTVTERDRSAEIEVSEAMRLAGAVALDAERIFQMREVCANVSRRKSFEIENGGTEGRVLDQVRVRAVLRRGQQL